MKQHGMSEEEDVQEFSKQVGNAWKDINKKCLKPTDIPMPVLMRVVNLARVIDVIYKEGDGYTHVDKRMRENVASLLIDSIPDPIQLVSLLLLKGDV
ncbi:Sesquiterpene synthase [Melia azedarach]|uniref:Sesquiterpene synthase n=1 Tax=Melia azedarach TaxID=155640 RepID=A0ACC1XQ63_MELAZ|nr:Sesquiterpene synthase [Melia azedarach]